MFEGMKAAIFDMDGTLIDSMDEWRKLNISFVRECGVDFNSEQEKVLYSMSGMLAVDYLKNELGIEVSYPAMLERSTRMMEPVYRRGVPLKPGAGDYLRRLGKRGVKRVICTATPAPLALIALNRIGLIRDLDYVFSTEIVGGSKGDPAFYDRLCDFIGEKKEDCVMFEDALYAMKGARGAGLGVVGVADATNLKDRQEIISVCDVVIDSYDELP